MSSKLLSSLALAVALTFSGVSLAGAAASKPAKVKTSKKSKAQPRHAQLTHHSTQAQTN
jgi:hypothetical protein